MPDVTITMEYCIRGKSDCFLLILFHVRFLREFIFNKIKKQIVFLYATIDLILFIAIKTCRLHVSERKNEKRKDNNYDSW